MKHLLIIGNWKANKTALQATHWLKAMEGSVGTHDKNKEIIVCPPFSLLIPLYEQARKQKFSIVLGAQNISAFPEGAYTGEMAASLLSPYVSYTIVGHSERRMLLQETENEIAKKVHQARQNGIIPILCVQEMETPIPPGVSVVAYEPISAIGTGNPDSPENANAVAKEIKEKNNVAYVLYGGSVTSENVRTFTSQPHIDGVLVGKASLDPDKFIQIINNA